MFVLGNHPVKRASLSDARPSENSQILGYVWEMRDRCANFGTRSESCDRCADRTNVRLQKGRRDFPGDNEVINESVVNIYKSIKFLKQLMH